MIIKIFLLITDLLLPAIMLIFGMIFKKKGPKDINMIYGYRTAMSMKNQETWNYAHVLCGQLWRKWGLLTAIFSFFIGILSFRLSDDGTALVTLIMIMLQLAVIILSIYPVEKALKANFDENGKRKN